jgi:hypothetical protein
MLYRRGLVLVLLLTGCASIEEREFTAGEASAKVRQQYHACLFAAADKISKTPTSAEDITAYAEGECRTVYLSYADTLKAEFSAGAGNAAEKQYAHDKADAHLRQMQLETRQVLINRIGLQSLTGKAPEPESK